MGATVVVGFRLEPGEAALLRETARLDGLPLSEFVRQLLLPALTQRLTARAEASLAGGRT